MDHRVVLIIGRLQGTYSGRGLNHNRWLLPVGNDPAEGTCGQIHTHTPLADTDTGNCECGVLRILSRWVERVLQLQTVEFARMVTPRCD